MSARAVICVALAACGDNLPDHASAHFPAVPRDQLDLLILVDNSVSGLEHELSFANGLPRLRAVLGQLDAMPSLHLGVATSDLGTTGSADPMPAPAIGGSASGACHGAGDDGVFRTTGLRSGATFLVEEGGVINADAPFVDTVTKLVESAGGSGCGFEQHLAGIRRALTNPANGAFLRPEANLAIAILGDEDDCSVRDPALFVAATPDLGPLDSFRCTRAGLVCNEDIVATGAKTGCHSSQDSRYVDDVATFVDFVVGLKPDRRQVMAAAIVGDPSPVAVASLVPQGGSESQPTLVHSCTWSISQTSSETADPGVRDGQFATSLGGPTLSICHADLAEQLADLGHAVKRLVGDPCLADEPVGSCTLTDEHADGTTAALPACPADGDCYALVADVRACPDTASHLRATITRVTAPPDGTFVTVRCTAP